MAGTTIDGLNSVTSLTSQDEVPVWDAEASGEPTKKITAQNMTASVKTLGNLVNTSEMNSALAGKQNTLTFDSTPTAGSTNPVTSGGIATAIAQSTAGGAGYFKSQDGTMIQWGTYTGSAVTASAVGSLYMVSLQVNISFPVQFVGDVPAVAILQQGGYGAAFTSSVYRDKIASVDLARPTSGSITPTFTWIAIGRWK